LGVATPTPGAGATTASAAAASLAPLPVGVGVGAGAGVDYAATLGVATPKIDGPGGSGSHDGSLKGKGTKTSTRWSGLFSSSYKVLELAFFLAELV